MNAESILVTGAAGFLGSALCMRLAAAQGARVTGAGRSARPAGFGAEWVTCDLADQAAVDALIEQTQPTVVFHLAGRTLGAQGKEAVWPNLRDNLLATVPLLSALTGTRCRRVVLTASLRDPDFDTDEVPTSPYAAAKAASSAYARMFHRLYQLPVVIARPFMVYGPGRQDMSKLVPFVASRLLAGQDASLSSGKDAFDFVFIDDVVEGLLTLASKDGLEGGTIDLGTGRLTSVAQVATGIADRLGKKHLLKLGALPDRRFEPQRSADVEGTAAMTGWRARTALPVGIDRFLAWYASAEQAAIR
jgi:nucleoside-diphosphate-sugar epimerase